MYGRCPVALPCVPPELSTCPVSQYLCHIARIAPALSWCCLVLAPSLACLQQHARELHYQTAAGVIWTRGQDDVLQGPFPHAVKQGVQIMGGRTRAVLGELRRVILDGRHLRYPMLSLKGVTV